MKAGISTSCGTYGRRAVGLYFMISSMSLILLVTGLSALLAVRIERRAAEGMSELGEVTLYAQSAIELGMDWIETDPAWRTSRGEGLWAVDQPMGRGKFSLMANDLGTNNQLQSSSETDPLLMTATGIRGDAQYQLAVTLNSLKKGLSCLGVALHADGAMTVAASGVLTSDQVVSSNNTVTVTLGVVNSDVESAVAITNGGTINGSTNSPVEPRDMPNASTVFDYYVANGTYISSASLASCGGQRCMKNALLSPNSNPYSAQINAQGIYIIDCTAQAITIDTTRIVGTLVLLNATMGVTITGAVNFAPAIANYPTLLVQGNATLSFSQLTSLDEGAPNNTNFNPTGTPYNGAEDTDQIDSYPTMMQGLVYVSGAVTIQQNPIFDGALVCGGLMNVDSTMDLTYKSTFLDNPPPGFSEPVRMIISPGTWKRVVN